LARLRGWKSFRVLACVLLAGTLGLLFVGPLYGASQDGLCSKIRPLVNGGRSDPLGLWAEAGLRCPSDPWTLQLGYRYTQVSQEANPFVVLSYDHPLNSEWRLFLTGSLREHVGDYEVSRLPEATLRWTPAPGFFVVPTIDFSAGWITSLQPQTQTTRGGGVVNLGTRPVKILQADIGANWQLGDYFYGTGQSSDYWVGTFNVTLHPTPATSVGLTYLHQEGFGVSPLLYDAVGYDQYVIGQFTVALNPTVLVSLGVTYNLIPGQPSPVRDVILSYVRPSEGWAIGVGWHQNGALFLTGTAPP
jgi:TonB dependent receptor